MNAFSFDDTGFGITYTGNVLDVRLVDRPPGLTLQQWFVFAGTLARALNERSSHGA